jgi:hypothetical protein
MPTAKFDEPLLRLRRASRMATCSKTGVDVVRVDHEHVVAFAKGVDRAALLAIGVLAQRAVLGDDVLHA